jgi:hypothetical protein
MHPVGDRQLPPAQAPQLGGSLSAQHDHAQNQGAKGGGYDTNHQIGGHRNSPFPAHAVNSEKKLPD